MTAPRVRVWSRHHPNGAHVWRWSCPACSGGTTRLCHTHASALTGALRHVASRHHPSGASSTPRH
jgi:hypothetical protein